MVHLLLHGLQVFARGNVFGVISIAEQHDIDTAAVAARGLLQRQPLVLSILVAILRHAAFVGVVLALQPKHHLAVAVVAGAFRHGLDGERDLGLFIAAHGRDVAPAGLAGHLPFAFGLDGDRLLVFCAEGAGHRGAAGQFVVGGNALELTPALRRLITGYGRNWRLHGEVVPGHAVKGFTLYTWWHGATTDDRSDAETLGKGPLAYRLHGLGEDHALEHLASRKCLLAYAHHALWNAEDARDAPVVGKSITAYMLHTGR